MPATGERTELDRLERLLQDGRQARETDAGPGPWFPDGKLSGRTEGAGERSWSGPGPGGRSRSLGRPGLGRKLCCASVSKATLEPGRAERVPGAEVDVLPVESRPSSPCAAPPGAGVLPQGGPSPGLSLGSCTSWIVALIPIQNDVLALRLSLLLR